MSDPLTALQMWQRVASLQAARRQPPPPPPPTAGELGAELLAAQPVARPIVIDPAAIAPSPAVVTSAPVPEDIEAAPSAAEMAKYGASKNEIAAASKGPIGPEPSLTPAEVSARWEGVREAEKTRKTGPAVDPKTLGNKYDKGEAGEKSSASGGALVLPSMGGTATIPAHEVQAVTPARQGKLTGAITAEEDAVTGQQEAAQGQASAQSEISRQKAIGSRDLAKAAEDAGVDAKLRAQDNAEQAKVYRKQIDDFGKRLASDKIDHSRMWNNAGTGTKIVWTIAKMFGAFQQAALKLPTNQIADQIQDMAAQDVADQRANHEIGRERLGDMNTMYAQALRVTGDREEAERLATGYALKAAEQNAIALSHDAQSKADKERGNELAALLAERRALIGQKKAETEIKMNPYVQARTVGTGVDMKAIFKSAREYTDEQAKVGTTVPPDAAIRWAYKMHTGQDPMVGGQNVPFVGGAKKEPGGIHDEMEKARIEVAGGIGTIERARESGAAYKQGPIGELWSHVPGATDSKMEAFDREKYNAQGKALVGAAWKLTTSGMEPKNPHIIEELSKHFQIQSTDSPALAQKRMDGLQNLLRDAGTSKGVLFEESKRDAAGKPSTFKLE